MACTGGSTTIAKTMAALATISAVERESAAAIAEIRGGEYVELSATARIEEHAMNILGSILEKVLGKTPASSAAATPAASVPKASGPTKADGATNAAPSAPASTSAPVQPGPSVDVAAVLDDLSDKTTEKLDWRHSVVDLMKLLSIDSSLAARKELAKELHYDGDTSNSSSMNIWLHKQIMAKLAANGGKLPEDLKS